MVFWSMHERYPYFRFSCLKSYTSFLTAKILWLFTIKVHVFAAVLSAGPGVTSTFYFWIGEVSCIPTTWIVTSSTSKLSFSNVFWSTQICNEPVSHKAMVYSWDPVFPWTLTRNIFKAPFSMVLPIVLKYVSSLLTASSTDLIAVWSDRLWFFSQRSIPQFLVLQSLIWWLSVRHENYIFFHNLIAIMIGLVLECFRLPKTRASVLQWALVSVLFVTDNSFENTANTFGSLLLESRLGLPGSYFDASMQLKHHACTTACCCSQVFKPVKLGGFELSWGFSKFLNHFRLMSRGNFPVTICKLLGNYKSLLYSKCWGTPTKFERVWANSTKLLESCYFIVEYVFVLDSCADMMQWGCPNFLFKALQAALNFDPE